MTPFEYVSVLISIILGLGITQIVTGIADVIQNQHKNKFYLPHAMWVLFVFFLHVQEWWVLYEMRTLTEWKLPVFLFTIIYPIGLFVLARFLFPPQAVSQTIILKEFYYANYLKFFGMAVVLIVLSILDNVLINAYPIRDQIVQLILLALLSFLIYIKSTREWVHVALAFVLLLLLLISMAVADWTIRQN